MRTGCRVAVAFLLVPALSFAQTTRTSIIEQQIKEKEQHLRPYEPGKLESLAVLVESHAHLGGPSTTAEHQGWYPRVGALPLRGGLSAGAGYRARLSPRTSADAALALSLRGYRQFETGVSLHRVGDSAIDLRAGARWRDYPRERFFGLGSDAPDRDPVSYRLRDAEYSVAVTGHPRPWLTTGFDGGYLNVRMPQQPDFIHSRGFVEADNLDIPGNPRSGGRYTVAFSRHGALGDIPGSFNQLDVEAMHLFPFVDKRRVIALRGIVSIARPDDGGEVPFYLMPSLGGTRSLRGFEELRFRDRNLLLLGAEYRWEAFAGLDLALFVDAGKVTHALADLNLSRLQVTPGIGFRFNALRGVVVTFDIAKSAEGRKYLFTFGPQW